MADAGVLPAQLYRGAVPVLRHHPFVRPYDGRDGARGAELRVTHGFRGYIHLKSIPEASPRLIEEAGLYADRLSINIELPTDSGVSRFAPEKQPANIRRSMADIRLKIEEAGSQPSGQKDQTFCAGRPEHADDRGGGWR